VQQNLKGYCNSFRPCPLQWPQFEDEDYRRMAMASLKFCLPGSLATLTTPRLNQIPGCLQDFNLLRESALRKAVHQMPEPQH
jgi:hypothetical protein